jgi:hypothetical protein
MTKAQIISEINSGNYYYNQIDDPESYNFWKQAVKKAPEFIKNDIADLRKSMSDVCNYDEELPNDFSFSKEFAEILKPLNLDILIDD